MPQIPTYQSKEQLTTQPPSERVNAEAFGQAGQNLENLGSTLENITGDWKKLRDVRQTTAAETRAAKRLNEIKLQVEQDPDIDNAGKKAEEEISKVGEETTNMIADPLIKAQYKSTFSIHSGTMLLKINEALMRKQIDSAKATLFEATDTDREAYFGSMNLKEKDLIKQRMKDRIDTFANAGIIDREAAYKYWEATSKEMDVGQVRTDMMGDASFVLKELQKGKEGLYPDIDTTTRIELLKEADNMEKKQAKEYRMNYVIAQDKNEAKYLDLAWQKKLSLDQLTEAMTTGQISTSFAMKLKRNIESPKSVGARTNPLVYDSLMAEILNPKIKASKIREDIMEANSRGDLSEADRRRLIYTKQGNNQSSIAVDVMSEQNPSGWSVAWGMINNFFQRDPNLANKKVDLMNKTIDRVQKDGINSQDIPKIVNQIIAQDNIESNPSLGNIPTGGQVRVDAYGNKARVYPDGRIEQITPGQAKESK